MPAESRHRELVDRYVIAFEAADIPAQTRLLTEDVILEMPPMLNWYVGREAYGRFIARVFAMRAAAWRIIPTRANAQQSVAAYFRDWDGGYALRTLRVFTVTGSGIGHNVVFQDPGVFATFRLAPALSDRASGSLPAR